jgi:DNA-binding beta-propeller fold protein YncE
MSVCCIILRQRIFDFPYRRPTIFSRAWTGIRHCTYSIRNQTLYLFNQESDTVPIQSGNQTLHLFNQESNTVHIQSGNQTLYQFNQEIRHCIYSIRTQTLYLFNQEIRHCTYSMRNQTLYLFNQESDTVPIQCTMYIINEIGITPRYL